MRSVLKSQLSPFKGMRPVLKSQLSPFKSKRPTLKRDASILKTEHSIFQFPLLYAASVDDILSSIPYINLAGDCFGNKGGAVFFEQVDLLLEFGDNGVYAAALGFYVLNDGALFFKGKKRNP